MSDWINVATTDSIEPGNWEVVELEDVVIAVFNIDGEFFAIEDVCTHDFATLTGLPLDGDQVICPRHGARFCVRTGEALTPPAYEPTACFPVRITDGIVQVRDNRWD